MICQILHPIFDALDDEFGFHGLDCGENYGSVRRAKMQVDNAQNMRRIKQRKGIYFHDESNKTESAIFHNN